MRISVAFSSLMLFGSLFAIGCQTPGSGHSLVARGERQSAEPGRAQGVSSTDVEIPDDQDSVIGEFHEVEERSPLQPEKATAQRLKIVPVSHQASLNSDTVDGGTITIGGRNYRVSLVEAEGQNVPAAAGAIHFATSEEDISPADPVTFETGVEVQPAELATNHQVEADALLLNLPTALSLISGDHPAVGMARWRVQEAYARVDQADVLWLPGLQAGFSFHRHDGNYQASNGAIVDVNRSSFQYGFGAGGTGAGTTPRPGLQAQFHLADALFEPEIARRTAWARGHAERATVNRQMRDVALAYTELLNSVQQLRIVEESRSRVATIAKLTQDFAEAGQGLQADADRMDTELTLIDARIISRRENVELSSSRLAHAVSSDPTRTIIPMDVVVVPLEMSAATSDKSSMIRNGLHQRPELKESQALVAAACEQYRRQKTAPFVPSVLLGLSTSGFGGGVGSTLDNVDGRYDFDAMLTWEVRNLGFGEKAAQRTAEARVQQAMFAKLRLMDDVARQISDAHTQTRFRRDRMTVTRQAIDSAQNSYSRNLSRIRDGQGLPLEVLQSVQALEDAQQAYSQAVTEFNASQFELQWAMGWRVTSPSPSAN